MNPSIDYHALAPEIVLTATIVICLLVDLFVPSRPQLVPRLASLGVLAALIPVLTLAADGADRSMFGGAIVIDNYALAFQGFFLVVAYLSLLLSFDTIGEGDYYRGEYYVLLLTSVLGLLVMAMSRDLVSCFFQPASTKVGMEMVSSATKIDTRSRDIAMMRRPSTEMRSST